MWAPTFTSSRLPNGVVVETHRDPYLPMVSIAVGLRGGFLSDPAGQAGLSLLMLRAMVTRTERLDRLQLAAMFDVVGGVPFVRVIPDGLLLQLDVLEDRLPAALELLAAILQRPSFTDQELVRLKDEQRRMFVESVADPQNAGMAGMRQVLYGRDHPLGRPPEGTRSSLAPLRPADLMARYNQVVHPGNVALVMSGRFDEAQAKQLVAELFGKWSARAPASAPVPAAAPPEPGKRQQVYYVPRPGLSQTVIVVGKPGLPEGHEDRYVLGMLARRVPRSASAWLRRVEQVTYGVSYVEEVNAQAGWFGALMSVDARATGMAVKSLVDRYDAMLAGAFDVEKVVLLTNEGMPYYSIVGRTLAVAGLRARGLPADHWSRLRQKMDDERDHRLADLTMQHISSDRLQVVLVGDPAAITSQVSGQGLGSLQLLRLTTD